MGTRIYIYRTKQNVNTVDRVYFVRYYCSRMANQHFRERVFFANVRKAVTTEDGKYPKNTQNTRKRA